LPITDDLYKQTVKACLEESGYSVELLKDTAAAQTADLHATCSTDSLLVEIKCKFDDGALHSALRAAPDGQVIHYATEIERLSRLSTIIRKAAAQIESSRYLSPKAFGILWFHPELKVGFSDEQIKLNLYGGRYAFVDAPDGNGYCMPCYYTTHSDFKRYAALAAVVLQSKEHVELLPNPFSPVATEFEETTLYKDLIHNVWTPEIARDNAEALMIRPKSIFLTDARETRSALMDENPWLYKHQICTVKPVQWCNEHTSIPASRRPEEITAMETLSAAQANQRIEQIALGARSTTSGVLKSTATALLFIVCFTGICAAESAGELWLRMGYTHQIVYINGFQAGLSVLRQQSDSQTVRQMAAIGIFEPITTEQFYPIIHKVNGFYYHHHDRIEYPLDITVFLGIAFVRGISQEALASLLTRGDGPSLIKEFYETRSHIVLSR
jgi:hypothetical protein